MRSRRVVLVAGIMLLTGVLAAGGFGAWRLLRPPLPRPEVADRQQLIVWLVTQDLNQESVQTRQALARRLEEEFRGHVDWEATGRELSLAQRRRLWQNLPALLEPWVLDKVDGYFGRSEQERPAYVDQVIDTISQWRGVNTLRPESAGNPQADSGSASLMAMLQGQIARIQQGADPQGRKRVGQFLSAVETRWFLRAVQGMFPKPQ